MQSRRSSSDLNSDDDDDDADASVGLLAAPLRDVPALVFRDGEWCPARPAVGGADADAVNAGTFCIVTMNVWFHLDLHGWAQRLHGVLKELHQERPAVATLQEVTEEQWRLVLSTEWVRQLCWVSHLPSDIARNGCHDGPYPYDVCMIGCGPPPWRLAAQALPGQQCRSALHCWPRVGGLHVVGVHLESYMENALVRRQQIRAVSAHAAETDTVVIGDWNNASEEELRLQADQVNLVDLWPLVGDGSDGFTFDTVANPMGAIHGKINVQTRCDVAMATRLSVWRPHCMRLICDQPMDLLQHTTKGHPMFASDHFGLMVEFRPPASEKPTDPE